MPTMATRSLMPFELTTLLRSDRAGLPEVVVDLIGGEQPAEGHLHPGAHLDVVDVAIGQLAREAAAAVEVEHGEDHRRALRVDEPVDRVGGHRRQRSRTPAPAPCRQSCHRRSRPAAAAGGRCQSAGRGEPTNPNFQSVERAAADEDGRFGVGRLGGSTSTMFRHVKNLP